MQCYTSLCMGITYTQLWMMMHDYCVVYKCTSYFHRTQVVHDSCTMATRAAILRVYSGHFGLEHYNC